jgi:hypothetical protein
MILYAYSFFASFTAVREKGRPLAEHFQIKVNKFFFFVAKGVMTSE